MRSFSFVVLDGDYNITDSFILDTVVSPSGLGFAQTLTAITTDTVDYIVKRVFKKKDIKLTAVFEEPQSYYKINQFRDWYCSHIGDKMALCYNDGNKQRYIDCEIREFEVTEIDTRCNSVPIVIQPLSPFYTKKTRRVVSTTSTTGKSYPFAYPYAYGGNGIQNAVVENTFYQPIPIRLIIKGKVVNPSVSLEDEGGNIYATVQFQSRTVENGETLIIDAYNMTVTHITSAGIESDWYDAIDQAYNTFLHAKKGSSQIIANLEAEYQNASVQMVYVQYEV